MNDVSLTFKIKRKLLLKSVYVNNTHKWKIYNIVRTGNKFRLYRGNASLIAEFTTREIKELLKGETLYSNGNSVVLV